ncbi:hypothetical protein OBBRIDRAFT_791950 [Obba rivulosa]|uniref:Tc1-like transposase DDE domain-containing protein n=1 Tax=Obba rivulosa TaxID=1052685 RepID=A0A8E2DNW0_9APHY|nr:hypothetical protein OBBRIDRAFT_791950 [Obba rivulosa]
MTRRYIPEDVKEQIVTLSTQIRERKTVARLLDVSPRTVSRVLRLARTTGKVVRKPEVAGRRRILGEEHVRFLGECVEVYPDITLAELRVELRDTCDVDVSIATILRTMQRSGFARKKLMPQSMHCGGTAGHDYLTDLWERYEPDQLVFVDASALAGQDATKPDATSAHVQSCVPRSAYYIREQRYSVTPAISLDGILHSDIRDQPHSIATFRHFIQETIDRMNSYPAANSVLIMENADIHLDAELRAIAEARGVLFECFPFSSDKSPMHSAFSAVGAQLIASYPDISRPNAEGKVDDPLTIMQDCVRTAITPVKVESWYHSCREL